MKAILPLSLALIVGSTIAADAENMSYTYRDDAGFPIYGAARRISPNGLWVCGGDDYMMTGSFIINTTRPDKYTFTNEGLILDIDDNGMAAGQWWEKVNEAYYPHAAIMRDGKWKRLPEPEALIGTSAAISISADSKVIAGHGMCENDAPDEPGKYFPITWRLNEATGEYELDKLYNSLDLPGTLGFFVSDMTPSATYIVGAQWLNFGGSIPVMLDVATGELIRWHELGEREMSMEFQGQTYYYTVQTVDGVIEDTDDFGMNVFYGGFNYATDRYIFGSRNVITQVNEDGTGTVEHPATVYDLVEKKFYDGSQKYMYICGTSPEEAFTSNGQLAFNGVGMSVNRYFSSIPVTVEGIYDFDNSGKIWVGSYLYESPMGDRIESPVVLMFDEAYINPGLSGVQSISVAPSKAEISVNGRTVTIAGARRAAIYTASGALVSTKFTTELPQGVYIVSADGQSHKIVIR